MNPKLEQLRARKNKERKNRPKHSFARRITRWVMATVLLTVTGLTFLTYSLASKLIERQSQEHFQAVMYSTTKEVDMMLKGVEIAVVNTLPDVESNLNDPSKLQDIMQQFLRLNPTVTGVALAFQSNFYADKGRWYEPYAIRTSDTDNPDSLIVEMKQIGSAKHDYLASPWFVKASTTGESSWTDPYADSFNDKGILCSYIQPVRDSKGDVVAVLCADVSVEWLIQQMQKSRDLMDIFSTIPMSAKVTESQDSLENTRASKASADDDDNDIIGRHDIYSFIMQNMIPTSRSS